MDRRPIFAPSIPSLILTAVEDDDESGEAKVLHTVDSLKAGPAEEHKEISTFPRYNVVLCYPQTFAGHCFCVSYLYDKRDIDYFR